MFATRLLLLALALGFLPAAAVAQDAEEAQATEEEPRAVPGQNEPVGSFRFTTERPVKVVTVGGSLAAYYGDNFTDYIEHACRNVEAVNVAKTGYGAWAMKKRFIAQVLKNRRLDLDAEGQEHWVIVAGGLNSIGTPEKTNRDILGIIELAHKAGMKVVGLTLTPWGDASDSKRWSGANALFYKRATQLAVDFLLGRLDRATALGRYAEPGDPPEFTADELPDVAVDLYDSPLRDHDAPLWSRDALARSIDKSRVFTKLLSDVPEAERDAAREALIEEATAVPRWFLRAGLRAFDHIHPNEEGHRLIALEACPKLPASWGCECAALASAPSTSIKD
jgi:hypothetical protein